MMDYIYDKNKKGMEELKMTEKMLKALKLPPILLSKDGVDMKTAQGFHNLLESLVNGQPIIIPKKTMPYIDTILMKKWGLERGIYYLALTYRNYDLVKMFENNINNLFFSFDIFYYTEKGDTMRYRLSQIATLGVHNPTSLRINNPIRIMGLWWPSGTGEPTYLFPLDYLGSVAEFINWGMTDPFTAKD